MSVSPSLRSAPEQMSDDSLRTELEELRRTIRANEDARAAVQAAYTDQMGELAERRSNIEEHVHQVGVSGATVCIPGTRRHTPTKGAVAHRRVLFFLIMLQELSKICGPVDEGTPEARASLEREIKDAKSQYSSLRVRAGLVARRSVVLCFSLHRRWLGGAQTKRREVKKRLKSSEERAAASNERLQVCGHCVAVVSLKRH